MTVDDDGLLVPKKTENKDFRSFSTSLGFREASSTSETPSATGMGPYHGTCWTTRPTQCLEADGGIFAHRLGFKFLKHRMLNPDVGAKGPWMACEKWSTLKDKGWQGYQACGFPDVRPDSWTLPLWLMACNKSCNKASFFLLLRWKASTCVRCAIDARSGSKGWWPVTCSLQGGRCLKIEPWYNTKPKNCFDLQSMDVDILNASSSADLKSTPLPGAANGSLPPLLPLGRWSPIYDNYPQPTWTMPQTGSTMFHHSAARHAIKGKQRPTTTSWFGFTTLRILWILWVSSGSWCLTSGPFWTARIVRAEKLGPMPSELLLSPHQSLKGWCCQAPGRLTRQLQTTTA